MSKNKTLLKTATIYTITGIASKILRFIFAGIYTYFVSTQENGIYENTVSIASLLAPIIILSTDSGIMRWMLAKKKPEEKSSIVKSCLTIYIPIFIVNTVFSLLILNCLEVGRVGDIVLLMAVETVYSFLQSITRGNEKTRQHVIGLLICALAQPLLNIYYVMHLKEQAVGLLISAILSYLLASIYLLVVNIQCYKKQAKSEKKIAVDILQYSLPFVFSAIAWWILDSSGKLIITRYVNLSEAGIYAYAAKFPALVILINSMFNKAWEEEVFQFETAKDKTRWFSEVINKYASALFILGVFVVPLTRYYVSNLSSPEYADAWKYALLLLPGAIYNSLSSAYGTVYQVDKKTKQMLATVLICALFNLIGDLIFVRYFGAMAAALIATISYILLLAIRVYVKKKEGIINLNKIQFIVLNVALIIQILLNFLVSEKEAMFFSIMIAFMVCWEFRSEIINILKRFKT